ncbi:ribosome silencing factor [Saccharicrinis aurantiacus]|uniref:ribosome silencing factor n=1 Tax=Saccharicrinis aurantiacus TaxID=1849719 RepID=UPI0008387AD0|nr:ribosome silencing factor [Saccharicrinis aurantiacus]
MINREDLTSKHLVDTVVEGIQEKKGTNIAILDMRKIDGSICQYYVICDGDSTTHVSAIADSIQEFVNKELGEKALSIEGKQNAEWVLVDFVDVIVHVFQRDVRGFYNLEGLWADAERTDIENLF